MIGYVCKYTPLEMFESMGAEMVRIQPQAADQSRADALLHPNMCSFVKAALEDALTRDYEGIVLTTCCDSVRRLYDALKDQLPGRFIYILDVPRKVNEFSAGIFRDNIARMIRSYEDFSGKSFDQSSFLEIMKRRAAAASLSGAPRRDDRLRVGLAGVRCSQGIKNLLEDHGVQILFDMTCTGLKRRFPSFEGREGQEEPGRTLYDYAWDLLNQVPCMRMVKASGRQRYMEGFSDRLDGIICHTVKFCDMYAFEYNAIKESMDLPVLLVDTDLTAQSEGQIRTRIEAFLESLKTARRDKEGLAGAAGAVRNESGRPPRPAGGGGRAMYVLGVDSGSTSTNAVIMDGDRKIVAFDVIRTGAKSGDSARKALENVLEKAGIARSDLAGIVSTGYGRVSIPYADENVTEISCHGRGAHYFNPAVRTVLDIGGQDSKAISLNEKGDVVDFVMNDKCAAGTGRFLEAMARTLEIGVDQLGPVYMNWKENIEITSMCTVFAESEVISLIARNKEIADIAHGIHGAIAGKAFSLLKRVGLKDEFMMTGGVALNEGVVKAVEERVGSRLFICDQPEIVGAVGAALFALEKYAG